MPLPEEQWFIPFADKEGHPWGDGTQYAARSKAGQRPWDSGCKVTPIIGGYAAIQAMCQELDAAIEDAKKSSLAPGQRGHVYLADWRFNPLRDTSDNNKKWASDTKVDPTIMGYILRLMLAGIKVRALFWLPTHVEGWKAEITSHIEEHFWAAEMIQRANKVVMKRDQLQEPLGIVGLDMRLPLLLPQSASHHQKMMVIRVGTHNVGFCGGVDLAYTRRDTANAAGQSASGQPRFLDGDWQSGECIEIPQSKWLRPPDSSYADVYAAVASAPISKTKPGNDLATKAFGESKQIWHDQHLKVEGPIVATLEEQFVERWAVQGRLYALDRWHEYAHKHFFVGQVIFSTASAYETDPETGAESIKPLPEPKRDIAPLGSASIQMWRTFPMSAERTQGPFIDGEYTVMAGIANACKKTSELIWIFDQYFWFQSLATLLNRQLQTKPNLHLLLILPPHNDTQPLIAHEARRRALRALFSDPDNAHKLKERIAVYDLWQPSSDSDKQSPRGIYCHAKVQMYDGNLLVCGSANLNRRSLMCDSELSLAVYDPAVVAAHQINLWHLLFADTAVPAPHLDLNRTGNGREFFRSFTQAASHPRANLIADPWVPGAPGPPTLPTSKPLPLEENPNPSLFALMYYLIFDPSSLRREPPRLSLDEWSRRIELPHTRKFWRRP